MIKSTTNMTIMLVLIILMSSAMTYAQNPLAKGLMSASGGVSWTSNSFDGEDAGSTLSLTPSGGYFINGQVQINVGLSFQSFSPPGDGDSFSFTTLLLGGRYFIPLEFAPVYAGGSFNYTKFSEADEASNSINIQAGILQFISDNFAMDWGLVYNKGMGDNKTSSITLAGAVSVFFTLE